VKKERLFIELYLDEDVPVLVADILRSHRFDVVCAKEAVMLSKGDEAQLEYAIGQGRALLTHNREHFEELHQRHLSEGRHHFGIIAAVRRPREADLARRILRLLDFLTADEMEDQLLYL
jgi:hypothetical protein